MAVPVALRMLINENYTGNWEVNWGKVAGWIRKFKGDSVYDLPWIVRMIECGQKKYNKERRSDLEDLWIDISITSGGETSLYDSRLASLRKMMLLVTIASFAPPEDLEMWIEELKNISEEELEEILGQLDMNLTREEKREVKKTFQLLSV